MLTKLASHLRRIALVAPVALTLSLVLTPHLFANTLYTQTNIVSNSSATPASFTDPNLVNPWGLVSNAGGPFWVSDQRTDVSTLYSTPPGSVVPLIVDVPPLAGLGPTGIVANSSGFDVNNTPALFIFATLDGTIAGWNGTPTLSQALTEASVPGAVFTGLAQASNSSGTFLFAADFAKSTIDVFDSSYTQVSLAGSFTDPNLPAGYNPYNIAEVSGKLYVEYAPVSNGRPAVGAGNGIIDVFDTNGNFVQRLITGGQLNVPWGITLAPSTFGDFGGDLLVGNFGNGWINAYDPSTGAFIGTLDLSNGTPFAEPALWSLDFGVGDDGGTPGVLYFTSGLTLDQTGGLLGSLAPPSTTTPEPSTLILLGSGLVALIGARRRNA